MPLPVAVFALQAGALLRKEKYTQNGSECKRLGKGQRWKLGQVEFLGLRLSTVRMMPKSLGRHAEHFLRCPQDAVWCVLGDIMHIWCKSGAGGCTSGVRAWEESGFVPKGCCFKFHLPSEVIFFFWDGSQIPKTYDAPPPGDVPATQRPRTNLAILGLRNPKYGERMAVWLSDLCLLGIFLLCFIELDGNPLLPSDVSLPSVNTRLVICNSRPFVPHRSTTTAECPLLHRSLHHHHSSPLREKLSLPLLHVCEGRRIEILAPLVAGNICVQRHQYLHLLWHGLKIVHQRSTSVILQMALPRKSVSTRYPTPFTLVKFGSVVISLEVYECIVAKQSCNAA